MSSLQVAVLIGSLRETSYSRAVALAVRDRAPQHMSLNHCDTSELPHYNPDLDGAEPPAAWQRFRTEIACSDAVLFITPEYNRSIPGALKNALDVGSRPAGQSVWKGKPAAIISVSAGPLGGFGANHHLRQPLVVLNMPTMAQPELYLGRIADAVESDGRVKSDAVDGLLRDFVLHFTTWVTAFKGV